MRILAQSRDFTKEELYKLTKNQKAKKMSTLDESVCLPIDEYLIFERENVDGEPYTVASIMYNDDVYVTNSKSFTSEFYELASIFGDKIPPINVVHGKSKRGREFITCALA